MGRDVQNNSLAMPLMLELKYEHFIGTWPGRIKCVELVRKLLTLNGLVSTYLAETESQDLRFCCPNMASKRTREERKCN